MHTVLVGKDGKHPLVSEMGPLVDRIDLKTLCISPPFRRSVSQSFTSQPLPWPRAKKPWSTRLRRRPFCPRKHQSRRNGARRYYIVHCCVVLCHHSRLASRRSRKLAPAGSPTPASRYPMLLSTIRNAILTCDASVICASSYVDLSSLIVDSCMYFV
jgi:hypothetical protein